MARRTGPILRAIYWARRNRAAAGLICIAVLFPLVAWLASSWTKDAIRRNRAQGELKALFAVESDSMLEAASSARAFISDLQAPLRQILESKEESPDRRLRAALTLGDADVRAGRYLIEHFLLVEPADAFAVATAIKSLGLAVDGMVDVLADPKASSAHRLRAGCLLTFVASNRMVGQFNGLATLLCARPTAELETWTRLLKGSAQDLDAPFSAIARQDARPEHRRAAAVALAALYADSAARLTQLLGDAGMHDFDVYFERLEHAGSNARTALMSAFARSAALSRSTTADMRKLHATANYALAMFRLGDPKLAIDGLANESSPEYRSLLMHGFAARKIDAAMLLNEFRKSRVASERYGLLIGLGDCVRAAAPLPAELADVARQSLRDDPDAGVHSAAQWLLRRFSTRSGDPDLVTLPQALASGKRWFTTTEKQTMAIFRPTAPAVMGSPIDEPLHQSADNGTAGDETQIATRLTPFALATCETTVDEFRRCKADYRELKPFAASGACPCNDVAHVDAARYCNWLTARDGLPPTALCYQIDEKKNLATLLVDGPNGGPRAGYRLPFEAEWEYACRAGTNTQLFIGRTSELLSLYAWHAENSDALLHPVGEKYPNPTGLFDIYGNAREWCEPSRPCVRSAAILRGNAFDHALRIHGSARRNISQRRMYFHNCGFRVARSL